MNKQQIEQALRAVNITGDYQITPSGVDVDGSVLIFGLVGQIPVQFNIITRTFDCSYTNITSLKGGPREVGGAFICARTKITSLEGAPREVGSDFICHDTNITSLEKGPIEVGGNFRCMKTDITSLEGAPKEVGGDFVCFDTNIQTEPDTSNIQIEGDLFWKKTNNK